MGGDTFYDDNKKFKSRMCTTDNGHYVKNISNLACVSVLNFQNTISAENLLYFHSTCSDRNYYKIFEVLTAAIVFWDMMTCSQSNVYWHAK